MVIELYLILGCLAVVIAGWVIRAIIRQLEKKLAARGDPNFWWGVHLRQRRGRMPTLRELAAGPTKAEKVHYIVYGRWPAQAPVPEPPDPRALDLDPAGATEAAALGAGYEPLLTETKPPPLSSRSQRSPRNQSK